MNANHIKLFARTYIGWDDCEYGAPAIDCKRPYGNSYVAGDIAEILGWPIDGDDGLSSEQEDEAREIHVGMQPALQQLVEATKDPQIQIRLRELGVLS